MFLLVLTSSLGFQKASSWCLISPVFWCSSICDCASDCWCWEWNLSSVGPGLVWWLRSLLARFCCPLKAAEGDIRRITLYRQHGGAQRVCVEASLAVCGSWAGSSSRYSVGSESQLLPCKAGRLSQLRGQAMRLRPTLLHPCCWSSVWFPWVSALMPWW